MSFEKNMFFYFEKRSSLGAIAVNSEVIGLGPDDKYGDLKKKRFQII
jgi:hypothetical protein